MVRSHKQLAMRPISDKKNRTAPQQGKKRHAKQPDQNGHDHGKGTRDHPRDYCQCGRPRAVLRAKCARPFGHPPQLTRLMAGAVQLHGGAGYMNEYPIARAWRSARVTRIYGGTNEIMKEVIGRAL